MACRSSWWLILLAGPACAFSQSALYQAIHGDQATAERILARTEQAAELAEGKIKAGPATFSMAASYSLEFNDNVNTASSGAEGDLIHLPVVTLGFATPLSEQSDLAFDVGIGYQIYTKNGELSRFYISPGTEVAWDIQIQDFFLTLYDQFDYTQDVASEAALSGQANYPRFDNTIGARGTYLPGKVSLSAGYGYRITFVDSSEFSYLDSGTHLLFARGGYFFAPEAESGVEVSGTITDFRENINPDGTVASVGPYLDWRPHPALTVAVRGGGSFVDTDASSIQPAQSKTTYYWGLDAAHELTEYISHSLSAYHGVRSGVEPGSAFIEQTSVNYQVGWAFRDPALFRLSVGYEHGEQQVVLPGAVNETFEQFRLGLGISYELLEKLSCQLGYELILRDSNIDGRDYTQNRVLLGASYQFR